MGNKKSCNTDTNNNVLKTHQKLLSMGFGDTVSYEASQKYEGDLNKSISYLKLNQKVKENMNIELNDKEVNRECISIKKCSAIQTMKILLKLYDENMNQSIPMLTLFNDQLPGQYTKTAIINDYVHILNNHNDDFEDVYNELNIQCGLDKCIGLRRNQSDKITTEMKNDNNSNINVTNDFKDKCMMDIMDRIHSYLLHTFDIGYKLKKQEKQMIHNTDTNIALSKMMNLLNNKRKTFQKHIIGPGNRRNYSKFLTTNSTDEHKEDNIEQIDDKMFSFGYSFIYQQDSYEYTTGDSIYISPKYVSFKQELINNDICTINIEEFENEYQKAMIHFNTDYRKKTYAHIQIEYLLSLMIYCNYTRLQYEFSKTYRVKNGILHNNFYHLGKMLKMAVHKFGRSIHEGHIHAFYHGMSEKLLMPAYIGCTYGVCIKCPLSTSSAFCVATNFTNNNNGMIVEFGGYRTKYFSVGWLSDFANESEYFFLQNNEYNENLDINNIFDGTIGYEYKVILNALKIIDSVLEWRFSSKDLITESMLGWIRKIIDYRLNDSFECLNEYGKKIINTYCENKKMINVNYLRRYSYKNVFDIFVHSKYEWINIGLMRNIFPNVHWIRVWNVHLTSFVFDDILHQFAKQNKPSPLNKIEILKIKPDKSIQELYDVYKLKLNAIGLNTVYNVQASKLTVCSEYK